MNEEIKKILAELYEADPALKERETEMIKIVQQLVIYRPDTKFDPAFGAELKSKLLKTGETRQGNFFKQLINIFSFMDRKKLALGGVILVILIALPLAYHFAGSKINLSGGLDDWKFTGEQPQTETPSIIAKLGKAIDDWSFKPLTGGSNFSAQKSYGMATGLTTMNLGLSAEVASFAADNLGFAVGGAKDINNFRQNIANKFLPLPTDITYEGLFYDYYFDTGRQAECQQLFCPSYSYAVSNDPVSQQPDYYLAVGLNSNIKATDFQRKKLNLVVVMDISGSMSSPFDRYYYDQFGKQVALPGAEEADNRSKMAVANESVVALLDHLKADDRFGMVLFDQEAYLAKPLNLVGETDLGAIKKHILETVPQGSTNLEAGLTMGTDLFKEYLNVDQTEYENRIIVLTDAMPNTGNYGREDFLNLTKDNADHKLSSSFIGIGVDFNTDLVESITKIRGANYYSVHSAKEFKTRMADEFEYMVTPLVFNLQLKLSAPGYQIEQVYGSPEASEATGEIMKVNTLFPSKQTNGETKGGLVLLKLKKTATTGSLNLSVSYEDRNGKTETSQATVNLEDKSPEYFQNNGIRKGILLARYADLVKDWINDERQNRAAILPLEPVVNEEAGIVVPDSIHWQLSEWERQSLPLTVAPKYQTLFSQFQTYFDAEVKAIGDQTLSQESTVLKTLSAGR
ncbi:MAG: VWA domain-containing protein [Patescibacteria group bacterium]|jgi:Ca-activated chloride channel family protein